MHLPHEADGLEYAADFFQVFDFRRHERKSPDRLEQGHFGHCSFYGGGVRFDEIYFHEWEICFLQLASGREIAVEAGVNQGGRFRGNFVGYYGNYAVSAEGNHGESDGVVAGEHWE